MHYHLIGICCTAMASLAGMLQARGHEVTGSDQNVWPDDVSASPPTAVGIVVNVCAVSAQAAVQPASAGMIARLMWHDSSDARKSARLAM